MSIQLLTRTSPASLRDGASTFSGSAAELDDVASAMDGEARGLIGTDWEGNAAEAFRGTWTEYHRPQLLMIGMLRESGEVMDQLAADLARAQERFRAAQSAATAAGVTIDMTTGAAAPSLAFTDPADPRRRPKPQTTTSAGSTTSSATRSRKPSAPTSTPPSDSARSSALTCPSSPSG